MPHDLSRHPQPTARAALMAPGGWRWLAWPLGVLLVGAVCTLLAAGAVDRRLDGEARAEFERLVDRVAAEAQRRFNLPISGLNSLRSLYAADLQVSLPEFAAAVAARDLPAEFPGVRGFGFIEKVMPRDVRAFSARVRAEGAPDFEVRSGGGGAELFVVRSIEPRSANAGEAGFDAGSDAARRLAIETAIIGGTPTLSRATSLTPEPPAQPLRPGFIVHLPVYASGGMLDLDEDRWRSLRGVLFAPVVVDDMLAGVADAADGRLDIEVFDGPPSAATRVFDSGGTPARTTADPRASATTPHRLSTVRSMTVGGRAITLRARATEAFDSRIDRSLPATIGAAGAAVTLLAAWAAWLLASGRARVAQQVRELTAELSLLAKVARYTSNAVIVTDSDRRVRWVNEGFTRITGYTSDEAIGRSPGALLQCERTDPLSVGRMRDALTRGQSFRGELLNRGKSGREYWIDIEVQPLLLPDGTPDGFIAIESEISERVAAREALARERARLADILDGTNAGDGEWNLQTGELRMSERWAAMFGYSLDELAPLTATTWVSLCHPDDIEVFRMALNQHIRGHKAQFEVEVRMHHRDGHWLAIEMRGRVSSRTADGRAEWLSGTHIDVTQRRHDARRWQARAELSSDWFWLTDAEHRLLDLEVGGHASLQRMSRAATGLRRDQIPGVSPPEGDADWAPFHARLDRHEPFRGVCYRVLTDEGRLRWFEIEGRPRHDEDGSFLGYEGVGRDVTHRRRATDELRASLALIDALFQGIPVPVVLKDTDCRYLRMNKAYADLFGTTQDQMVGKTASEVISAEAAARHDHEDRALLASKGSSTYEVSQTLQGGRRVDALVCKSTLLGADGRVIGLVGTMVDISEQKAAQRALAEAKDAAEAATRAKSAFLATMSHEIRTPMNGVLGMAELLAHSRLDDEQAQTVNVVRESATALLRLIDAILDFSKIEAGRLELESEPVDLSLLVEGACDALAPVAAEKQVTLHVFVAPACPQQVLADPVRVRQLLNNLVGNAIKFSAGQAQRNGRVTVRVVPAEGGLRFSVTDNGIGIDDATLARLFTPFTQAEVSTTRRFGGTGLGLAICKRLAELMQGRIEVSSQPGQGSTFAVWLPAAAVEGGKPAPRELAGLDCIVIADPALPVDDLRAWLEQAGARVFAADGTAGATRLAPGLQQPCVLIQADSGDGRSVLSTVAGCDLRQLLIGSGRRGAARVVAPAVAALDLLRQGPFLRAVAMLAGRASPEAGPARPGDMPLQPRRAAPSVAQARASGQLILVAEDDVTNRKVIARQLALLGHAAELVTDGASALARWRDGAYALLLTDLHMPGMDGHTLTGTIRREERATGRRRLPILALTANALQGEANRARGIGMDDYLTKPVLLQVLQAALERWMPTPGAADEAPAQAADAVDLGVLHAMVGNDPQTVRELLEEYLQSAREQAAALRQAWQADDARHAAAIAHKLKSASRSVGALELGDLCAAMEGARSGHDVGARRSDLRRFEQVFGAVVAQIEGELGITV